ncbi:hypothetical protein SE15_03295 [Thermanaerothrix daxensis]|uniref:Uncharacterized protein n=1 Tax=Thermanaerothrix daxensis TaxID=869279 RepID=A0A0P6XXE2_9CHLR|nr:hypothetical protein [Thermanaerothrix daxensis]KPL84200.1 hypothetical protein SE15_03295 [Thermanaerothrix daxensis]
MKRTLIALIAGALLYVLFGVDLETLFNLNGDAVLLGVAGALALGFLGYLVWAAIYLVRDYPIDRRLNEYVRRG